MPLYEYLCPNCQTTSEIITQTLDHQIPLCPKCLQPTQRKPSTFQIRGIFRWYKPTDYGAAGR